MKMRGAARGLTLVEVVVAMAVLSLIVLALGASLRGLSQSAERVDARVQQIDEMRLTAALLRELLASVAAVRADGPQRALLFEAGPQHLAWIAVMPARFGPGGQHALRLAAETLDDGSQALVLRFAPWRGEAARFPDWTRAESRVLVHALDRLGLGYDGQGLLTGWESAWPRPQRLPARLRLDIQTQAAPWPPIVLPLRTPPPAGAGFVIGGSTR